MINVKCALFPTYFYMQWGHGDWGDQTQKKNNFSCFAVDTPSPALVRPISAWVDEGRGLRL